jgi:high-affinity K+ transport system ATPase subunit B
MSTASSGFLRWVQNSMEKLTGHPQTEGTIVVGEGEEIPREGEVIDGWAKVDRAATEGVSETAFLSADPGFNQAIKGGLVLEGSLTIRFKVRGSA